MDKSKKQKANLKKIFNKVYIIDRNRTGFSLLYLIQTLFFSLKAVKKQIPDYDSEIFFDDIYCTDCNSLMCALYLYNLTRNPNVKVHLTEDGARNYCYNFDHYIFLRKIMNFFGLPLYSDFFSDTIVFETKILPNKNIKAIKQPNFNLNLKAQKALNELYEEKIVPNEINSGDIIYFDQPFFENKLDLINKHVKSVIFSTISIEKLKIKPHPRQNPVKTSENILKTSAFEAYFINESKKLDDLIFISISSTTLFSGKIIFKKEPTVIFLYEIFKNQLENLRDKTKSFCYTNGSFNDAVRRLRELYVDKEKVLVPKTIVELKEILAGRSNVKHNSTGFQCAKLS
jgi:hypothetical protein